MLVNKAASFELRGSGAHHWRMRVCDEWVGALTASINTAGSHPRGVSSGKYFPWKVVGLFVFLLYSIISLMLNL